MPGLKLKMLGNKALKGMIGRERKSAVDYS